MNEVTAIGDPIRKVLERPFPPEKVKQKRGQGNRQMSYISHGLVTERLNDADQNWESRTMATHIYTGADGMPHCAGVEIELTVDGVSRVEAGGPQRQDGFANEIKNSYSDALKRAAMRFGVALEMWESLLDAEGDEDYADPMPPERPQRPQDAPSGAPRYQAARAPDRPASGPQDAPQAKPGDLAGKIDYASSLIRNNGLDEATEIKPFGVSDIGALTPVLVDRFIERLEKKVGAPAATSPLTGMPAAVRDYGA